MDICRSNGDVLRVEPVNPHVFRIRLRPDSNFREAALVKYGIVHDGGSGFEVTTNENDAEVIFSTERAQLVVAKADGRMTLQDDKGAILLRDAEPPQSRLETGFRVEFELSEGERLYGLGDETRDRIQKRGHKGMMVLRNVTSYVPIPFLMSTGGWAIFLNTTWFHHFDAGATRDDRLTFYANRGELDYYIIAGATLPELLDRYTQITGRPCLLPQWGYGLTFVCDERGVRARDILYESYEFRRHGLPCDVIGLEPDWMEKRYDFSVNKRWSPERFHIPEWLPGKSPGGFTAALGNMGFKLSLWLCCDYDVSEYEEQLLKESLSLEGETRGEGEPINADADRVDEDVIKDPNFVPAYQDQITKPGESWFEHLKKFVDDGAEAFKMDGSNQICFHPDRKWKNGMDDEEMHNLYPVLLGKQMAMGYKEHTGKRAMIYTAGGYAGIQQYAATWAGDTGGGEKPLISLLNHGLSGHSNVSCDMQVWNREGIHFGFLQPWSQVLSWHQYNQPWFLGDKLFPIFSFYAKLRYRLLPYIYSMAHVAARTGLPIMRAMPLVAPDDPKSNERTLQYLLGDAFLTAAFTNKIALPEGRWIDYWTGEVHDGPKEMTCTVPEDRGGPLFVRAGSIIPTWPEVNYVGQRPMDTLGLDVYPCGESSFTLYEDDGITHRYLEGEVAETHIECNSQDDETTLTIGPRSGAYEDMPDNRTFEVRLHHQSAPAEVWLNGVQMSRSEEAGWSYDGDAEAVLLTVSEDPDRRTSVQVRCVWK